MAGEVAIWYLIGSLEVGGTERTLVDLVNGLDRSRFSPEIWTITEPGPLASHVSDETPIHSLDATGKHDVRPILRFATVLRRRRPDVLQSFLFFDNVVARLAGLAAPSTTVISGLREDPSTRPRHRKILDRATLPLADLLVANSQAGAAKVTASVLPATETRVVWNGRPVGDYDISGVPTGVRESLGVPEDVPVVGTVGRLVEIKGHHDVLHAWPSVLESHPTAHLVIVGDGPEAERLEERVSESGVDDHVHLAGQRDDVPELLATFDLFVLPSHQEGLPGALIEAMAAGLPIVSTSVGGSVELVTDGVHGLHVPPGDPQRLADAIVTLLSDTAYAERLGQRAKARSHAQFTLEAMVAAYETIYLEQVSCSSRG